ncbi:MAG: phosphoenolpyruvate carboxykinase (ATP) [Candidatus Levybacteria bacterium]|nr:phosphoenolpyruvate carboxykinase (ATP) [Candidatus Levybacteria bacterium]
MSLTKDHLAHSPEIAPSPQRHINLSSSELHSAAIENHEGVETVDGVLAIDTMPDTGRSPKDKFVVEGVDGVDYGSVNQPISRNDFNHALASIQGHLASQPNLYYQDLRVGADSTYSRDVKVVTEQASSALFANALFLPPVTFGYIGEQRAGYSIYHAPSFKFNGAEDGVRSHKGIIYDPVTRTILIGGTKYAGEIKKSVFSAMQCDLPEDDVATMHCSANMSRYGDVAIFFGLSGTGKTTLSADPERTLIGDDEHGWSDDGVFNFEGGSYAKLINLSESTEPLIYRAVHRKGALLENVNLDENGNPIFDEGDENMRGAFPISYINGASKNGVGVHPKHIIMLTADASGVLPPVARLSNDEAIFQYLSGYTSKVAGTEIGVTSPEPTFSACFGSPFLTRHPSEYARLLEDKIKEHNPSLWLVNTGWPGGYRPDGRMKIPYTRSIISGILASSLDGVAFERDGLGFMVPTRLDGVPSEALRAENYWNDQEAYRLAGQELVGRFEENAEKFSGRVRRDILASGPHIS